MNGTVCHIDRKPIKMIPLISIIPSVLEGLISEVTKAKYI